MVVGLVGGGCVSCMEGYGFRVCECGFLFLVCCVGVGDWVGGAGFFW